MLFRSTKLRIGSKVISKKTFFNNGNKISNGKCGIITSLKPFIVQWKNNTFDEFKSKENFTLAFALTVHKAQGMTKSGAVIINPSKLFAKNHLYVALTRATSSDNVYFTCPILYRTFRRTTQ